MGLVASHMGWTGVLLMALFITALGILFYSITVSVQFPSLASHLGWTGVLLMALIITARVVT